MVGRPNTPEEQAAWNKLHLKTRVDQAGVGIDAAKSAVGRARKAREAGNLSEAARHLSRAANERSIAFRFGADTHRIGASYGMAVPSRTQGATPVNKARGRVQEPPEMTAVLGPKPPRGRRSWMPGKGLG